MSLQQDPRIAAALKDEKSAVIMLNELHRRILTCRDPNMVSNLLSRYLAIIAARQSTLRHAARTSKLASTVSNLLKKTHDTAQSIINNLK